MTEHICPPRLPCGECYRDLYLGEKRAVAALQEQLARAEALSCIQRDPETGNGYYRCEHEISVLRGRLEHAEKWNRLWQMAAEMVCADEAFFSSWQDLENRHDNSRPVLCLLMNDVFMWALADAERVSWEELPGIYAMWKEQGYDGLIVWSCKRRGNKPQKPMFDKLKPEVQAQVAHLPRFGGDDGWGN